MTTTETDRRAERRAARRADNRTEILDAAERVFGEDGLSGGSLRNIAAEAGFSPAALYLFFDNKQALVAATLSRRGDELIAAIRAAADSDMTPIEKLHRIVDDTIAFFTNRPHFRLLLRHLRGGASITGPVMNEYAVDDSDRFSDVMGVLARLVRDGQDAGEIRAGSAGAIAHLYSVLVNEFVLLSTDDPSPDPLTTTQFHGLVDGALRQPRLPA